MDAARPFEFERQPGYARLTLGAQLNAFQWEDLQRSSQQILGELEGGRQHAVVVDLTQLDYLGSAQLTVLVRIWKLIKEHGGRMIVEVKAPVVREVLRTAGLLNVWEVAESRDAAVQMLGLRADGRQKTSRVLPTVGVAALVAALAGAGLTIWRAGAVDARIVLAVQLACSAIALGSGLWTAIYCSGPRRGLGVGLVVASAVVSVAVVFHHPRSSSVRPSGRSEPRADKPARKPSEQGTASRKPPKNPN